MLYGASRLGAAGIGVVMVGSSAGVRGLEGRRLAGAWAKSVSEGILKV